ncbi:sensor domain-containing phosphodiesterase [Rummeliibacillus sp. JY-2-4R]
MHKEQAKYSRLSQITKLINTNLSLCEVLDQVTYAIAEDIVQCHSIGIYFPQNDGSFKGKIKNHLNNNEDDARIHIIHPDSDWIIKEVVKSKKTLYIPNTSLEHCPQTDTIKKLNIHSLIALPFSFDNELFGLVFLFNHHIEMNLSENDIQMVETYVGMASVAIRNAKELTYKEHLIKEKQLLLDATRDLSLCTSMQDCIDRCFFYLVKVLGTHDIGLHLLDPIAFEKLKPMTLSKDSDLTEEEWILKHQLANVDISNDAVMQEVYKTHKAVFIPDVTKDDRPNKVACENFGINSLLMMPLISMGENLGQFCIANLGDEEIHHIENTLQLAQSITDATASTLANLLFMEKQVEIIENRTSELSLKNQELEQALAELQLLSREKELILNSAGEGIFGLDLHHQITFCNPSGAQMLGYETEDELIGQSVYSIFHGIPANLSIQEDHVEKECEFFRKDDTSFPVEYVISCIIEDNEIVGEVVTFKDIKERKQLEEKITYHAYYDSLTGLPNRVLLTERLTEGIILAKEKNEKIAMLYLDLDRFKYINDSLGHSIGDHLLCDVANRLSECVPPTATLSRQGGDEFAIYLPQIKDRIEVLHILNRITQAFSMPFQLVDNELFIKASIGISLFPEHGDTTEMLIKNADTAMYKAKEVTGNSYHFFSEGMAIKNYENIKIENALYKALENGEFVLYYQPQINYQTMQLEGVEALVRWIHPIKGIIPPDQFIPIAEETGMIIPLGEWVLKEACKQMTLWLRKGYKLKSMSVNISVCQFEQINLFSVVKNIIKEVGLAPEYLQLELTENLIIKNTELTLKTMKELNALGIKIAIDDFGTGYSSLGYLRNLPISTLKIDKSFVDVMCHDEGAITNTIINLAKNLNLNVIAEGVETKDQAEVLQSQDCTFMQGYYFSKPITATDFEVKYFQSTSPC